MRYFNIQRDREGTSNHPDEILQHAEAKRREGEPLAGDGEKCQNCRAYVFSFRYYLDRPLDSLHPRCLTGVPCLLHFLFLGLHCPQIGPTVFLQLHVLLFVLLGHFQRLPELVL